MDHNIALLPESRASRFLVNLSRVIDEKVGSQVRLGFNTILPHLTLYLTRFPNRNIEEVDECLNTISLAFAPLKVRIKGWTMSKSGSIMLNCRRSKKLDLLHRQVIARTNVLREGILADVWRNHITELTAQQSRLLETVGFPYALELWAPHFTISKIDPRRIGRIEPILNVFEEEFYASEIGLYSSDDRGAVVQRIRSFELCRD